MPGRPYGTSELTELLAIKCDPALKADLVQQAEQTQTSLSAVVRLALRAGLPTLQQQTYPLEVRHA